MPSLTIAGPTPFTAAVLDAAEITFSGAWPGLSLGPLTARLWVEGTALPATAREALSRAEGGLRLVTHFGPPNLRLEQNLIASEEALLVTNAVVSESSQPLPLGRMELLTLAQPGLGRLSEAPAGLRIYEQGPCWVHLRPPGAPPRNEAAYREDPTQAGAAISDYVWLAYDRTAHQGLLVAFVTADRWLGWIGSVETPDAELTRWAAYHEGGDLVLQPGERLELETLRVTAGPDPLLLLEEYGDWSAARAGYRALETTPVSWNSWYPYRLGVTAERVLANAELAHQRLVPLGLDTMVLDLGWQRSYLPSAFEANDQFPEDLDGLARRLQALGLKLGVWSGVFTVNEHDPVAREHPDWLLGSPSQQPHPLGAWTWHPRGQSYALDLTHPEARNWLRANIRSLAERGVRYLKTDFTMMVCSPDLRRRYDPRVVAGGGTEALRLGLAVVAEEMRRGDPEALILHASPAELPGLGSLPLVYTIADTGNTGFSSWPWLRDDFGANLAGHLWKHRRWGVVQPSCLCLGLPGTLEEARVRATAAFLSGGQIDVGDDLTVLPEDRWQVLEATLPPLGTAARPVDLFEPLSLGTADYAALVRGEAGLVSPDVTDAPGEGFSRVWRLPVHAEWDDWTLVGLFDYGPEPGAAPSLTRLSLPLERLGLDPAAAYWGYEFWSGQFLGPLETRRDSPHGYIHPGDAATLVSMPQPGVLEVVFFGPGVKLLVLRRPRPHPWPVGTTFHQSGGRELEEVNWRQRTLRGVLRRPAGQRGALVLAGAPGLPAEALVEGKPVAPHLGAHGSVILPVVTTTDRAEWSLTWP